MLLCLFLAPRIHICPKKKLPETHQIQVVRRRLPPVSSSANSTCYHIDSHFATASILPVTFLSLLRAVVVFATIFTSFHRDLFTNFVRIARARSQHSGDYSKRLCNSRSLWLHKRTRLSQKKTPTKRLLDSATIRH